MNVTQQDGNTVPAQLSTLEIHLDNARQQRERALAAQFADVKSAVTFGNGSTAKRIGDELEITFSEFDEQREEAETWRQALVNMVHQHTDLGKAIIHALWNIHKKQLIAYLGHNPEDFEAWARSILEDIGDTKYINQLIYVVTKVLEDVYCRELAGTPYVSPTTGEAMTVEKLIERDGMVSRLISMQPAFAIGVKDSDKEELLDAAINGGSRAAVDEVKRKVFNKHVGDLKFTYAELPRQDGLFDLVIPRVTAEQIAMLERLFGGAGEKVFSVQ